MFTNFWVGTLARFAHQGAKSAWNSDVRWIHPARNGEGQLGVGRTMAHLTAGSTSSSSHRPMRRWLRLTLAVVFFLLGVVGIFVPVMPQLLFFAISGILLAPDFPPARRLVGWIFSRWPKLQRALPRRFRGLVTQDAAPAKSSGR